MRKFIVSIIAFVMIASILVGCGGRTEIPEGEPIIMEGYSTESPTEESPTEPTEVAEEVKWDIPDEEYVIDITHEAQTDFEKLAWAIYMEAGADSVCDDCRRRVADVILNRVECKITNTGNDYYWPDTITDVVAISGINPYRNMGNSFRYPDVAHTERERHSVERAYRIAHEVLRGNHSEIYREGYFYYAGANEYGHEPETAIYHCGIYFMRQRGWDNSKFEQDWFFNPTN